VNNTDKVLNHFDGRINIQTKTGLSHGASRNLHVAHANRLANLLNNKTTTKQTTNAIQHITKNKQNKQNIAALHEQHANSANHKNMALYDHTFVIQSATPWARVIVDKHTLKATRPVTHGLRNLSETGKTQCNKKN
jgi:hypothetical protein